MDRAFARAVAMAALRRLGEIDQILDRRLKKSPPDAVRTLMRIALAQILVLETPAFAAVSTAVKLAERDPKTRPYKNLVNAVLRGVGRDGPGLTTAESNLPDWISARWKAAYGEAALVGLALAAREEFFAGPPPAPTPASAVLRLWWRVSELEGQWDSAQRCAPATPCESGCNPV